MTRINEKEILTEDIVFENNYNNISSNILLKLNKNNLRIIDNIINKYNVDDKENKIVSRIYIYKFCKEFNIRKIIIPKMFNNVNVYKINKIENKVEIEIAYNIVYNSNKDIEILLDNENIKEINIEIISKSEVWPSVDNLIFIKY